MAILEFLIFGGYRYAGGWIPLRRGLDTVTPGEGTVTTVAGWS